MAEKQKKKVNKKWVQLPFCLFQHNIGILFYACVLYVYVWEEEEKHFW